MADDDLSKVSADAVSRLNNMLPAAQYAVGENGSERAVAVLAKAFHMQPDWTREWLAFVLGAALVRLANDPAHRMPSPEELTEIARKVNGVRPGVKPEAARAAAEALLAMGWRPIEAADRG